jgi:hypothetical protein
MEATVSCDLATKKAPLNSEAYYHMASLEGESSAAEENAGNPLAEDKRCSFATPNRPTPPRRTR